MLGIEKIIEYVECDDILPEDHSESELPSGYDTQYSVKKPS